MQVDTYQVFELFVFIELDLLLMVTLVLLLV